MHRPLAQENWLGGQVRAGGQGRCRYSSSSPSPPPSSLPTHPHPGLFCLRCYFPRSRITLVPDPISQGNLWDLWEKLHQRFFPHLHLKLYLFPYTPCSIGLSILAGNGRPNFLPRVPSPLFWVHGLLRLPRPGSWTAVPDSTPEHVALDSSSLLPQSLSPSQSQRLGIHRLFSHLNRSEGQVC